MISEIYLFQFKKKTTFCSKIKLTTKYLVKKIYIVASFALMLDLKSWIFLWG